MNPELALTFPSSTLHTDQRELLFFFLFPNRIL
jgi:hypothetical protein